MQLDMRIEGQKPRLRHGRNLGSIFQVKEDEALGGLRTVWFQSCRTPLGCARRFAVKSRFLGPEGARNDKGGDAAERLGAMRGEIFRLQAACGFEQLRR